MTVKKKLGLLLSIVMMVGLLAACGNNSTNNSQTGSNTDNAGGEKKKKVALVLAEEIGVNPFFELMEAGFEKAGEDFNVETNVVESTDAVAFEQNFRTLVAEGYDLIVTASFTGEDVLRKIATENPELPLAIIDHVVDLPNVRSVAFIENEASFLLGAAAGLVTESNVVGNVVAVEGELMDKYTIGFKKGLAHTNPEAKIITNYVGSFVDAAKAKELAITQNAQGADFIAGMSAVGDFGVFEAAAEKGFYTSGQDVDRTSINPEHVILSQLKGVDAVAYDTVKQFVEGTFEYGAAYYGLADGGVGLTHVTHESATPVNAILTEEDIATLKQIAEDIKNGKIDTSVK